MNLPMLAATVADLNIEALATHLAWADVNSHVMSDSWYGFPDPDDETQMRESFEIGLPLDGATVPGPWGAYPRDPGQFAARWNAWSEERRAQWLDLAVENSRLAIDCALKHERTDAGGAE